VNTLTFSQGIAVAVLAAQAPLATLDGQCAEGHGIPSFVLERVELPYGASGDCQTSGSRGPSCLALGVSGSRPAGTAAACPPGE
jgi:hypothetical protein